MSLNFTTRITLHETKSNYIQQGRNQETCYSQRNSANRSELCCFRFLTKFYTFLRRCLFGAQSRHLNPSRHFDANHCLSIGLCRTPIILSATIFLPAHERLVLLRNLQTGEIIRQLFRQSYASLPEFGLYCCTLQMIIFTRVVQRTLPMPEHSGFCKYC